MSTAVNVRWATVRRARRRGLGVRSRAALRRRRLRGDPDLREGAVPLSHRTWCACGPRRSGLRWPCRSPTASCSSGSARRSPRRDLPGEAYVRILLTRGVGEIVYDPAACPSPTVIIIVKPLVELPAAIYADGVDHCARAGRPQPSRQRQPAHQVEQPAEQRPGDAAGLQARRVRGADAQPSRRAVRVRAVELLPGGQRRAADAAGRSGPARRHHPRVRAGAGGVTGIHTREETLYEEDLASADEAFLTSSTKEIVPVVAVDSLTIGEGVPGPLTKRLLAAFRTRTGRPELVAG